MAIGYTQYLQVAKIWKYMNLIAPLGAVHIKPTRVREGYVKFLSMMISFTFK